MKASQSKNVTINEDVAYLMGVLQSDGCIYNFYDKKRKKMYTRLILTVAPKSLPMAIRFQKILSQYFGITVNLRNIPNTHYYRIQASINRLKDNFANLKNEHLLEPVRCNISLFGAYLAGLIDGDGHIKIKNNHDRIFPQCVVRISEDHPMYTVNYLLKKFFDCNSHFEKDANSRCIDTCFYISEKNIHLFYKYVYPHITLKHKIERLNTFWKIKMGARGFEPLTYRSEADRSIQAEPRALEW